MTFARVERLAGLLDTSIEITDEDVKFLSIPIEFILTDDGSPTDEILLIMKVA